MTSQLIAAAGSSPATCEGQGWRENCIRGKDQIVVWCSMRPPKFWFIWWLLCLFPLWSQVWLYITFVKEHVFCMLSHVSGAAHCALYKDLIFHSGSGQVFSLEFHCSHAIFSCHRLPGKSYGLRFDGDGRCLRSYHPRVANGGETGGLCWRIGNTSKLVKLYNFTQIRIFCVYIYVHKDVYKNVYIYIPR